MSQKSQYTKFTLLFIFYVFLIHGDIHANDLCHHIFAPQNSFRETNIPIFRGPASQIIKNLDPLNTPQSSIDFANIRFSQFHNSPPDVTGIEIKINARISLWVTNYQRAQGSQLTLNIFNSYLNLLSQSLFDRSVLNEMQIQSVLNTSKEKENSIFFITTERGESNDTSIKVLSGIGSFYSRLGFNYEALPIMESNKYKNSAYHVIQGKNSVEVGKFVKSKNRSPLDNVTPYLHQWVAHTYTSDPLQSFEYTVMEANQARAKIYNKMMNGGFSELSRHSDHQILYGKSLKNHHSPR